MTVDHTETQMPNITNRQVRTVEFYGASINENTITGAAAVIGNLDSYRTVMFPSFFSDAVLQDAVDHGFMADMHDWTKPIGTIKSLQMDGRELRSVGEFHTDDESQQVRTRCIERQARGKTVGQSIGFGIGEQKGFKSGSELIDFARRSGEDMSLFDVDGIMAHTGQCAALLRCSRLYEFSPVSVPANDEALADSVRSEVNAVGIVIDGAHVRGQYLGEDIEETITMTALSRLVDRLMYRCFYKAIYGEYQYDYDADEWVINKPTLEESLEYVGGGCDELKTYALKFVEAIMSGVPDAETPEAAMTSLRALYGNETTKTFEDGARAARSFDNELDAALAAARGCIERAGAIQAARALENRTISGERVKQLHELRSEIGRLIEAVPKPLDIQSLALRARSLELLAYAE